MVQTLPIYQQIKEYLKSLIIQNQNNMQFMLPSEKQIAMKFNSSRIPAKRALEELKSEGLIYRIQGKGSFICKLDDNSAFVKKNICLLLPNFTNKFIIDIVSSIQNYCDTVGFNLFIVITSDVSQKEDEIIEIALEKQFDGFIIFPVIHDDYTKSLLKLALKKFPTVFIGRKLPGLNISSIGSDHYLQTINAMTFLLNKGHKNIGFITEEASASYCYENRIHAYKDSILEKFTSKNLHLCEIDFFNDKASETFQARITENIEQFFAENPTITSIITSNLAVPIIYDYMKKNDLPIDMLEIIMFDAPEYTDFLPYPPPLAIDQQPSKIGHLAAEQLYNQIINNELNQQIMVESRIINSLTKEIIF